jgi:hypothetical protein
MHRVTQVRGACRCFLLIAGGKHAGEGRAMQARSDAEFGHPKGTP